LAGDIAAAILKHQLGVSGGGAFGLETVSVETVSGTCEKIGFTDLSTTHFQ
jgi:hypothetical protein